MIYGIIPVGGSGSRLGLPFSKLLLPLKGYDKYFPVIQHSINNVIEAGVEKIFFIHGKEYDKEIVDRYNYFKGENDKVGYFHILNQGNQVGVFTAFNNAVNLQEGDIIYYALPDSYYSNNPFLQNKGGLQISMMRVSDDAKVGRINIKSSLFEKNIRSIDNIDYCWTTLKFDYTHFNAFIKELNTNPQVEVEDVLNQLNFNLNYINCDYYDLGTFKSLNKYWKS